MSVLIIDYGMGNLASVQRAFVACGADAFISDQPEDVAKASHFVLPGVGAFADGMAHLRQSGWIQTIQKDIVDTGRPLLGICLGMQLFATKSFEGGEHPGLNLIPGEVRRFQTQDQHEKIPHVGWNGIEGFKKNPLLDKIPEAADFYFVHSYHFCPEDPASIVAWTSYCGRFVAIVSQGKIFGVQFHPEKSSQAGFQLIRNFLCT